MKAKKQFVKVFISLLVIASINFHGVFLNAQDIVSSSDISSGSSVFVFRKSRKQPQAKLSARLTFTESRSGNRSKLRRRNSVRTVAVSKRKSTQTVASRRRPAGKNPKITLSNTLTAKADVLLENKETDKAIETYREALKNNPKNLVAAHGLSDALTAKGIAASGGANSSSAVVFFDEAVKLNAENALAHAELGEIYAADEKPAKAVEHYETALRVNPALSELNTPLGLAYIKTGEIAKAENSLAHSDKAQTGGAETEYLRGLVFYKQNKNTEALTAFNKAASLDPELVLAHYYQAVIYDRLNQPDQSIAAYQTTVQLDPQFAPAWFDLGVAHYNRGDYKEAEAAYKKTISLDNGNSKAHANLASTYRQQEHYAEANAEYKIAAEGIKDDPDLYSEWGFCLGKVNEWDKAVARLETAADISPDAVDHTNAGWGHYNAGKMHEKNKDEAKAQAEFEAGETALKKAVEDDPQFAPAHLNLGSTYNAQNDFEAAVNSLNQAVAIKSDWVIAVNELGLAYRGMDNLEFAVRQFQRAVSLDNTFALGFYNLGETEYKRGNKKEAKKAQESLKKLNPDLAQRLQNVIAGKIIDEGTKQLKKRIKIPF